MILNPSAPVLAASQRHQWAVRCVCLALAATSWAATAHAADPAEARATTLAAEARKLGKDPRSIGVVTELREVLPELGLAARGRTLATLGSAPLHPLARAQWTLEMATLDTARGDRKAANARLRAAGWQLDWDLLGPFGGGAGSITTPFGPETDPTATTYTGRLGEVRWRSLEDRTHLGVVDPQTLVRPMDNSVAYARTRVQRKKPSKETLRISARGPYRAFLDGNLVGERVEGAGCDPSTWPDADAWPVSLPAGPSTLLIKLSGEEGASDFAARLTTGKGKPTTPLQALESAAKSPRDLARAALLSQRTLPEDSGEPHLALARRAREAGTPDADTNALLAEGASHAYERLHALDAAAAQRPDDPWLGLLQARAWFASSGDAQVVAARGKAEALVAAHPEFAAARRFLATVLMEENLVQAALWHARNLFASAPDNPKALANAVSVVGQTPDKAFAWKLCQARLKADASNLGVYTDCVGNALERRDHDGARKLAATAMLLRPDVTGLLGLTAQVELATGRPAEARKWRIMLTALVPGDASYWIDLGLHDAEYGTAEDATQAFAKALAIEPQNADLEQYSEFLNPSSGPRPEDAWVMAAPAMTQEQEDARFGDEDFFYLVDQKVTRVFDSGLTSTFVQQIAKVRTDLGATSLRSVSVGYTPDSQAVKVKRVRVTKPDGSVRETRQTYEQSLSEPWYNLYYDYAALVIALPELGPGDVVEVQYTIQQTGATNILGDYFGAIETLQDSAPKLLARYTLLASPARKMVTRAPKLPHEFLESQTADGLTSRAWTFRDVPKIPTDDQRPGYTETGDYLHLSTYGKWDEVTRWYWDLVDEQLVVDNEIRKIVTEQTNGLTDRRKKVAALHNWVVQNTRYVGLEFGIHGFKPYRTTECLKRRFGDCKDKASLIKVMLDTAGIPANIVLVRTRRNGEIDTTPASLQIFDHAIAYVPEFDLFLDGTAEYSGTSELPWGDQGVQVLIVKDGGEYILRKTPILPAATNSVLTSYAVDLRGDVAVVDVGSTLTGAFAAGWRERYQTRTEREERFRNKLSGDFPGSELGPLQFSELSKLEEPVKVSYRFKHPDLTEASPKQIRLKPVLRPARLLERLAPWTKRKQILEVGHPFVSQEAVEVTAPTGAKLSSAAGQPVVIESAFGRFELSVRATPTGASVTSTLQVDVHRVTPGDYPKFRDWLRAVDQALQTPLVFERYAN